MYIVTGTVVNPNYVLLMQLGFVLASAIAFCRIRMYVRIPVCATFSFAIGSLLTYCVSLTVADWRACWRDLFSDSVYSLMAFDMNDEAVGGVMLMWLLPVFGAILVGLFQRSKTQCEFNAHWSLRELFELTTELSVILALVVVH